MRCPRCAATVPAGVRFCPQCGAALDGGADPDRTVAAAPGDIDTTQPAPSPESPTSMLDDGLTQVVDASSAKTQRVGVDATRVETPDRTRLVTPEPVSPSEDFAAEENEAQGSLDAETRVAPPIRTTNVPPASSQPASGGPADGGSKRHLSKGVIALIVIAAIAVVCAGAYAAWASELWGGHSVPDVVGMDLNTARDTLTQAGFATSTTDVVTDDSVGKVVSTDPAAGTRADTSKTIALSVGVARTVPDVVGHTLADAQKLLSDSGYTNVAVTYEDSDSTEGTVTAVSPAKGATAAAGDAVTITVAQAYTVPTVVGLSEADAKAAVEKAGLISSVTYQESDQTEGTVLSSSPEVGTRMQGGATVELVVAKARTLSDPLKLASYYNADPSAVSTFLSNNGWQLSYGSAYQGIAEEIFTSGTLQLTFTQSPLSHDHSSFGDEDSYDVLAQGAAIKGVRLSGPASALDANDVSKASVETIMSTCGFSGATSTCTPDDFTNPYGATTSADFYCEAGVQGDYTWSVLVYKSGSSDVTAAATLTPTSELVGSPYDTSGYNNSFANLVAYYDLCTE